MHSMGESATEQRGDRRSTTTWRITRCAQRLADEHGLDGFTMEELAEDAAVSRRTLFNHFPGKIDAVLGPVPEVPAAALEVFRNGGPHQDLVLDLRDLADAILEDGQIEREDFARLRRLLLTHTKLLAATHDRFQVLSEQIVLEIMNREGSAFGRQRARVAVAILVALFDSALEAFLADTRRRTLTSHFNDSIRFARELFG
jgi:AcrR family transcriptional regulator